MPRTHGRPTVAEVSLAALRANCARARELVGPGVAVMAVVKADAYGHGGVAAARAFVEAGAVSLGVSTVEEGMELRQSGIAAPIVVLGGAFAGEEAAVVAGSLETAVWSLPSAQALGAAGRAAGRPVGVHVKVETGMGRLGVQPDEVPAFVEAVSTLDGVRARGLFSHLASADAVDTATARAQIARFAAVVEALAAAGRRPEQVHLANSAAVLGAPEAHFGMVRPGIMLYGYAPAPHLVPPGGLAPAMRLKTVVAQARHVEPGATVGYGATFVAARPGTIAVLPVGYADGYHRLASNRAAVLVRGRRVPVAGRVCMDHTMVDVTDAGDVGAGEPVVLFGPQGDETLGADELAGWCDTISYEMLVAVGRRVPRAYVERFDA